MRLAILALAAGLAATSVHAADMSYKPARDLDLPLCDNPSIVSSVIDRQNWVERNTWNSELRIVEIGHVDEFDSRTQDISLIDQRNCRGRAVFNTGEIATVYYVLYEELGFAGISYGLNVCTQGRDFYRQYDADCRVLR